ncbi:hypothetical protein PR048_003260 [Dryococelus australis]|uniref:Uncharacterized protein n=1 Tax=Dryococelus australis TaxID=614101 RepID=A0ABQ9IMH4_9NEOP|nr:hypothetical protein PR048_003260 [Dryococelus australis]
MMRQPTLSLCSTRSFTPGTAATVAGLTVRIFVPVRFGAGLFPIPLTAVGTNFSTPRRTPQMICKLRMPLCQIFQMGTDVLTTWRHTGLPPRRTELNLRRVTSGFSHVGIVPNDAAGRRVFWGITRFSRPSIPALLHTFKSPSSALKTSLLRAVQISSLTRCYYCPVSPTFINCLLANGTLVLTERRLMCARSEWVTLPAAPPAEQLLKAGRGVAVGGGSALRKPPRPFHDSHT